MGWVDSRSQRIWTRGHGAPPASATQPGRDPNRWITFLQHLPISTFLQKKFRFEKSEKICAPQATKFFLGHFCNKNRKYLYRYSIPACAASGGFIAPQANFFEILDLSEGKIDVFDAGREQPCMHKRTLYSACTTACDAHVLIRAHVTRKRG